MRTACGAGGAETTNSTDTAPQAPGLVPDPDLLCFDGIAVLDFGTTPEDTYDAVRPRGGYRHIDTAQMYGNGRVGAALREASEIAREDLFVTTKVVAPTTSPSGPPHPSLEDLRGTITSASTPRCAAAHALRGRRVAGPCPCTQKSYRSPFTISHKSSLDHLHSRRGH